MEICLFKVDREVERICFHFLMQILMESTRKMSFYGATNSTCLSKLLNFGVVMRCRSDSSRTFYITMWMLFYTGPHWHWRNMYCSSVVLAKRGQGLITTTSRAGGLISFHNPSYIFWALICPRGINWIGLSCNNMDGALEGSVGPPLRHAIWILSNNIGDDIV